MALLGIKTEILAHAVTQAIQTAQNAQNSQPAERASLEKFIEINIEYKGNQLIFPTNPQEINISRQTDNITHHVLKTGEIVLPNTPNLQRINFTSLFWAERAPKTSGEYLEWLNDWRAEKEPARLIVVNHDTTETTYHGLNLLVLCNNFDTNEGRAGAENEIYYTLDLIEYREDESEEEIYLEENGFYESEPKRIDERPKPPPVYEVQSVHELHEVVRGESLWAITKKHGQPGTSWRELFAIPENRAIIGENPNDIRPGQQLIIPDSWR
ncbi:MAG: LysM peptidoglycan-binding domain-containing protein [Firmicutes bacterium]|nr:LysM peptidoglycan-binding domain-containing protein [Bacillota bacterium]